MWQASALSLPLPGKRIEKVKSGSAEDSEKRARKEPGERRIAQGGRTSFSRIISSSPAPELRRVASPLSLSPQATSQPLKLSEPTESRNLERAVAAREMALPYNLPGKSFFHLSITTSKMAIDYNKIYAN